jgi:hypothetical protein
VSRRGCPDFRDHPVHELMRHKLFVPGSSNGLHILGLCNVSNLRPAQLDLWPVYTFHFTDPVWYQEPVSHGSFRKFIKDNIVKALSTFVYPCPAQNEYFREWPYAATDIRTKRTILLCAEMMTDLRSFAHDIEVPERFYYACLRNQATVLSDFIFTDKTCKG